MTATEVDSLPVGLYRVWWVACPEGYSLAAIGMDRRGRHWLAPCNWINGAVIDQWHRVQRVELIERAFHECLG